jgi:hypothetical protein
LAFPDRIDSTRADQSIVAGLRGTRTVLADIVNPSLEVLHTTTQRAPREDSTLLVNYRQAVCLDFKTRGDRGVSVTVVSTADRTFIEACTRVLWKLVAHTSVNGSCYNEL